MINAQSLTMSFDGFTALNDLNCHIPGSRIYGLVGSNGAGKSTLLRLICGIYRAQKGFVTVDSVPVYENPDVKSRILYVPDDLYFLPQSSMKDMVALYAAIYKSFDKNRFSELSATFGLDVKANISTFSKGMKRQASTILALSARPDVLLFDETFDGLDPVVRNLVKQVIDADVRERGTTTIITSHSLRELEDTCDQLALLHKGGIVFESEINDLKTSMFKIQTGFDRKFSKEELNGIDVISYSSLGSVSTFIVKGDKQEVTQKLKALSPLFIDVLPLNLEEVFIYEMAALGYVFDAKEGGK